MSNYYEDEDICTALIDRIEGSFGSKRKVMLKELCSFKTKAADEFWTEYSDRYLAEIMMCRSDRFSDVCADKLTDLSERAAGHPDAHELAGESFFVLGSCMFKESDKMFRAYEEVARNAVKIRSRHINWASPGAINPGRLPDFLGERLNAERTDDCIESDFFSRLNDVIIITAANAITLDKEKEKVTERVKYLYDKYPDVYGAAGFFAHFVTDSAAAYEKFKGCTLDPISYPILLWVLGGLSHNGKCYTQNAPAAYIGEDNELIQIKLPLENIDPRWYEFLSQKPLRDIEISSVKSAAYNKAFLDNFTFIVSAAVNKNDPVQMEMCREYLFRAAELSGSRAAFEGLIDHGFVKTAEELLNLTKAICKSVSEGVCVYCFYDLFTTFTPSNSDVDGFCEAVRYAADYPFEKMSPEAEDEKRRLKIFADKLASARSRSN